VGFLLLLMLMLVPFAPRQLLVLLLWQPLPLLLQSELQMCLLPPPRWLLLLLPVLLSLQVHLLLLLLPVLLHIQVHLLLLLLVVMLVLLYLPLLAVEVAAPDPAIPLAILLCSSQRSQY
jgi:hypothetical protein